MTMCVRFLCKFFILTTLCIKTGYALTPAELESFFGQKWKWNPSLQEEILEGNTLSNSSVESGTEGEHEWQELRVNAAGVHPDSCAKSIPKMANFSNYSKYLSLIKESKYQDGIAWFYIDHTIMPFPMSLEFNIPPIKTTGDYVVLLTKGIFPNLKADLRVRDFEYKGSKCLFTLHAHWRGKKTTIPNIVLEVFTKAITTLSLDGLFRATKR